jgi:hypothetical protein
MAHRVSIRAEAFDGAAHFELARGVAPEGDFGAVNFEDARVAAGGAEAGGNLHTGKKTELHETAGVGRGEIDAIKHGSLAAAKIAKRSEWGRWIVVATQLQHAFSVR